MILDCNPYSFISYLNVLFVKKNTSTASKMFTVFVWTSTSFSCSYFFLLLYKSLIQQMNSNFLLLEIRIMEYFEPPPLRVHSLRDPRVSDTDGVFIVSLSPHFSLRKKYISRHNYFTSNQTGYHCLPAQICVTVY